MLVPVKWLKDFVDVKLSTSELADKLVSCGFEIEGVTEQKDIVKGVVSAKITSVDKHPNANKLVVCTIDVADGSTRTIVTNNTDLVAGDIVPVALDGAKLASGKTISAGELRGVHSDGMFCGGEELNLTESDYPGAGEDHVLRLLPGTPVGKDINEIMGTDDTILDIGITANRMDANSILGIAREVSAVTGEPLHMPTDYATLDGEVTTIDGLTVENKATDLCPRYMATMVKDVKIAESPDYIKRRLKAVGLRPINNIVDITNYILMEIGQPMHAFDLRAIKGGKIIVRRAEKDEKIVALDGKTYTLGNDNLVIANEVEPMAIAGVMGGKDYSVMPDTTTVVFESARFARDNVRRTSRSIGLRSDSSARFEKGVDYASQAYGMQKAIGMIVANGWGTPVCGTIDNFVSKPDVKTISFTAKDIEGILGVAIPEERIVEILNSLTLDTTVDNGVMTTTVPGYREDMVGINDIAEEVIRIYGYDHIVTTLLPDTEIVAGGKNKKQLTADKIKNLLIGKGAYEIVTYSFISPKAWDSLHLPEDSPLRKCIKLLSPLGEDYSVMRTTLAHSMIKTIATNYLRGNKSGRFFEVAKTYIPEELPLKKLPIETNKLAIGAYGEKENFYRFKAIIEDLFSVLRIDVTFKATTEPHMHPTRTAEIIATDDGTRIGYMGEVSELVGTEYGVDKRMYLAELDEEYLEEHASNFDEFKVVSKFPAMERDLALVCDIKLEANTLLKAIKDATVKLPVEAKVFDVYTGGRLADDNKKSVAVKLTFQSMERTLKDDEVNAEIAAILTRLNQEFGINLR